MGKWLNVTKVINQYVGVFTFFVLLCSSGSAFSAELTCYGNVTDTLIYNDGTLNVRTTYRNDYTVMCNLSTPRAGVSVTTCAMWAALLSKARASNLTVEIHYNDASVASCDTIPIYASAPVPEYVGF